MVMGALLHGLRSVQLEVSTSYSVPLEISSPCWYTGAVGEPKWLDDDEMAAWFPFVQVLMRVPHELERQLRSDSGFSHLHYAVLSTLTSPLGPHLTMTDLAEMT